MDRTRFTLMPVLAMVALVVVVFPRTKPDNDRWDQAAAVAVPKSPSTKTATALQAQLVEDQTPGQPDCDDLSAEYCFFACDSNPDAVPVEQDADINARLRRPISIHCEDSSLREVLGAIAGEAHVNIAVEPSALRSKNLTLDSHCILRIEDVRATSALRLVLEPFGLDFVADETFVWIDLPRDRRVFTKQYPVGDLAFVRDESGSRFDSGPLIRQIATTIGNQMGGLGDQWAEASASIRVDTQAESLFITQPARMHIVIAEHLALLRRIKREYSTAGDVDFPYLEKVLWWKWGYYPRDRLPSSVIVIRKEPFRDDFKANERSFESREELLAFLASHPHDMLRSGILCCRQASRRGWGFGDTELEESVKSFCEERDVDLFVESWQPLEDEAKLFRMIKSTKSIYKDEP